MSQAAQPGDRPAHRQTLEYWRKQRPRRELTRLTENGNEMTRQTKYLAASVAIVTGLLVLGWVAHGTGIAKEDPERNIVIPDELNSELQVKATKDGTRIWFHYRWPVDRPSLFNDVLIYQDGVWEERGGDAGTGPYTINWNEVTNQPKYMFNFEVAGSPVLSLNTVIAGDVGFNDSYYLSTETALPFDPTLTWNNGDTIPRRFLRPSDGSRGDVVQPKRVRWRKVKADVPSGADEDGPCAIPHLMAGVFQVIL